MNALCFALLLAAAPPQEATDFPEPLLRRIDVDLKERPAREAFDALFRRIGLPADRLEEIPDAKVTLSLKQAGPWEALDALCRAHGGVRPGIASAFPPLIEAAPFVLPPVHYHGPFRFSLHDVARIREFRYPGTVARTDVAVALRWLPDARPVVESDEHPGRVRIDRAEDDAGRSLLPVVEHRREFDVIGSTDVDRQRAVWIISLGAASPGATRLSRVEGAWTGSAAVDLAELRFELKPGAPPQVRKAGPFVVTMLGAAVEENPRKTLVYRLGVAVDPAAVDEVKDALKAVPVGRRLQGRVLLEGGRIPEDGWIWNGADDDPTALSAEFRGDRWLDRGPIPVTTVTVRLVVAHRPLRIPFAFRDVPLPEPGR